MNTESNNLNWFEIPATDIDRAKKFYETIFNIEMPTMEMGDTILAFFPYAPGSGKAAGGIAKSDSHTPSQEGSIIYLNGNPDLSAVEARVEAAGGTVDTPKFSIGENGFCAYITDTEGNRVGLHSME